MGRIKRFKAVIETDKGFEKVTGFSKSARKFKQICEEKGTVLKLSNISNEPNSVVNLTSLKVNLSNYYDDEMLEMIATIVRENYEGCEV